MVRRLRYLLFSLFTFLFVLVSCEETEPDDTDGNTGASIIDSSFTDTLSVDTFPESQAIRFPDRLIAYVPSPNQFANSTYCLPQDAESIIGGQGFVTLGGWGGYIIVGFNKAIVNHADNPYGVDFTIIGNAYEGSSEPGIVMVMQDENNNGLADDTWYELSGSEYKNKSTYHDYSLTYYYINDSTVTWKDNKGDEGTLLRNGYHQQSYYPLAANYPNYNTDSVIFTGTRIPSKLEEDSPGHWVNNTFDYGYTDNKPINYSAALNVPDNPETPETEGCGGDAFKLEWAVDSMGNTVSLDSIHFIKVYTAVFDSSPVIGDVSCEIKAIVPVK